LLLLLDDFPLAVRLFLRLVPVGDDDPARLLGPGAAGDLADVRGGLDLLIDQVPDAAVSVPETVPEDLGEFSHDVLLSSGVAALPEIRVGSEMVLAHLCKR